MSCKLLPSTRREERQDEIAQRLSFRRKLMELRGTVALVTGGDGGLGQRI